MLYISSLNIIVEKYQKPWILEVVFELELNTFFQNFSVLCNIKQCSYITNNLNDEIDLLFETKAPKTF